jgi:hypothetical protein
VSSPVCNWSEGPLRVIAIAHATERFRRSLQQAMSSEEIGESVSETDKIFVPTWTLASGGESVTA